MPCTKQAPVSIPETLHQADILTFFDSKNYTRLPLIILTLGLNTIAEKIDQWLAAPLPSSNHNAAMKKRQPTTGEWFTQSKEYADWKIRTNSFIWLHGIRKSYHSVRMKRY